MSTLITTTAQIGTIKDAGGNATAMTIDSAGKATVSQNVFNRNNSVVLRGFYLNAMQTSTGSTATLTNWSEMNSASKGFKPVGVANGVTVSSGLFSFAVTGVYRCSATFHVSTNNDTRWIETAWAYTPNGGSTSIGDTYNYVQVTQSDTTYSSFMREKYWNIAHTGDTVALKIGSNAAITIRGTTDQNGGDTWVFFEKVAEAV